VNIGPLIHGDRVEVALLARVVERADYHRFQLEKRFARLVVSEYAEAAKRGRKR
jgi:hypothetical protein